MSKYNSRRIITNDGVFDSKKEYRRWLVLKQEEADGIISDLSRQVKYELIPSQYAIVQDIKGNEKRKCIERACTYLADFVYTKDGQRFVEDVKGYRRSRAYDVFVIKRKLMLQIHNIRVKEI